MISALVEQLENCRPYTPTFGQLKTILVDIRTMDNDPLRKLCYLDAMFPVDLAYQYDPKRSLFVIPPWCSDKFDIRRLFISNSRTTWSYIYDFFKVDRHGRTVERCFVEVTFVAPVVKPDEKEPKHRPFEFISLKVYNPDHLPLDKKGESLIFTDKKCRESLHFVSVRYATKKELEKHEDWIYSTSHICWNESVERLHSVPEKTPKNSVADIAKKTRSERKKERKQKEPAKDTAPESKKDEQTRPLYDYKDVPGIIKRLNADAEAFLKRMENEYQKPLRLAKDKELAAKADAEAVDVSSVFDDIL